MADWIRIDTDFVDHPKVHHLATLLKNPNAGWYVVRAWAWVKRYFPSGTIPGAHAGGLETAARWSGEPGRLAAAMVSAGLLDPLEGGSVEIHDWSEKQGKVVEKAEQDRERQRRHREKRGLTEPVTRDVTHAVTRDKRSYGRDETVRDERDVTNEKRVGPLGGSEVFALITQEPPDPVAELRAAWNESTTPPIPRWESGRDTEAKKALRRRPLEQWREVFGRINASSFCRGDDGGWVASVDWALRGAGKKPETALKVLEGAFDNRDKLRPGDPSPSLFGTGPIVATEEQF